MIYFLKSTFTQNESGKSIAIFGNTLMIHHSLIDQLLFDDMNNEQQSLLPSKSNTTLSNKHVLATKQKQLEQSIQIIAEYTSSPFFGNKVKSWLARLKLIEIKDLYGPSETVYCVVQLGTQKYTSIEKSIQTLKFDEVRYY